MTARESELTRQLEQALRDSAALRRENQLLREKVNLLLRRVFGASSEKLDAAQLELLLSGGELVEPSPEQKAQAPQPKGPPRAAGQARVTRLPQNLPVVEEVIDPEPVKAAPDQFRQIGQEVSEQLDYEPARYFRRRGSRPGGDVFFDWHPSRAGACLDTVVPLDFKGTVQCDGYDAYNRLAQRAGQAIKLAYCWAHVRRKFNDALEGAPRTAGWMIKQIQLLYRIESRLREQKAGPALRAAVRAHQSKPVVQRLKKACTLLARNKRFLPQDAISRAMTYAIAQMPGLEVYLEDGKIEIDNNLVENAIRPTALGKKNWLFIGEAQAGDRSAIIYTVIESCRRRRLDPYAYLRDVLTRLPQMTIQQVPEILPGSWGKPQPLRKAP